MAIDSEHPQYIARKEQWEKMRDTTAGQEAIHAKTTKYLPKLSGQSDDEYKAYLKRTTFYGATPRTVEGLSGMVFRKPPQYKVPAGLKPYLEDVTLDGLSLLGFAEEIVDDVITVARAGILVDHPVVAEGTTKAQAEASNIRPFLKHYTAENIFNWKVEGRNNAQVLTQVRLWEFVPVAGANEFSDDQQKQIRVLDLDPAGNYRQRVFIENKAAATPDQKWLQFGPDIYPTMNGAPLTFIPFWFVGAKNGKPKAEKPPLIDLANVNLSHYTSTADLEHGAHFTGLPTAVITGHTETDDEKGNEYRIGAATAWIFPSAETKVQYLEFQGQGLEALENRIAKKEEQMAFLGARMLSPEKKAAETAETANIHRMGEISVLASLAQSVSEAIEQALSFMSDWSGFGPDVDYDLNKEFLAVNMSPDQLRALLQTWQAGGIAYADLLENLKKGEVVRDDRTADEIRSEVETENPFMGSDVNGGPGAPAGNNDGGGANGE